MNKTLTIVLICHFLAAFTVLGMPMYLPLLFTDLGLSAHSPYIGFVFAWPTLLTALSAPLWGRFADRFGRRFSLIRALAGLALAFVGVGLASNITQLLLALTLQGLMGGTLAAANSYLAATQARAQLASLLNWTQFSARLALVTSPLLLALTTPHWGIQHLYTALAALPLLGAVAAFCLPKDAPIHRTHKGPCHSQHHSEMLQADQPSSAVLALGALQALFAFSMVLTFPYFLPYAKPVIESTSAIALMYVLPHLVYLIVQPTLKNRLRNWALNLHLSMGLMAVASCMQWLADSAWAISSARLLLGVGICLGYHGLHQRFAQTFEHAQAGSWFGSMDGISKMAGVAAGLVAGVLVSQFNLTAPFLMSALTCLAAIPIIVYTAKKGKVPCTTHATSNKKFSDIKPNTTA